ncbi:hypothetical protein [Nitrobacter winogradskyi]|uniref:Uncharacterized protein n=1 Tax=Nitrobacter winogradskyi TaxID=913 RepID=A0ACC6ANA2_NITWI|nr:hypothetical protein [Nitrobacter winogradskyi]MCP2001037.1 hypothetical protein [Nitrobacter winogradskyi]
MKPNIVMIRENARPAPGFAVSGGKCHDGSIRLPALVLLERRKSS